MDKVFHCHSFVSDIPDLGEKLWGLIVVPFIFDIYITKKIPLVVLEEI